MRQSLVPPRHVEPVAGARATRPAARLARSIGGVVLAGHGLVHLMGVALLWHLAEPGSLRYADAHPIPGSAAGLVVGGLWLVAAALFVVAAILLIARRPRWRGVAVSAVVISLSVLLPLAATAAAGLVVDAGVLLAVLVTRPQKRSGRPGPLG